MLLPEVVEKEEEEEDWGRRGGSERRSRISTEHEMKEKDHMSIHRRANS